MRSLVLSVLLASLFLFSSCEARRWRLGGNAGAGFGFQIGGFGGIEGEEGEEGDPCEPSSVAWNRPCGEKTLLSGPEIEQLSQEEFGPNVCRYTFTFEVKKYKFELRRSSRCMFRAFTDGCPLVCSCTGECSEELMTVEKEVIDCCDGFTTPRSSPLEIAMRSRAQAFNFFKSWSRKSKVPSGGCTIRVCPDEGGTTMPIATDMPTAMPTDMPTAMPTDMPTAMPTDMPITEEIVIPTNEEIEG